MGCETASCAAKKAEKERIKRQYDYDKRNHDYITTMGERDRDFIVRSNQIQRENQAAQTQYQYDEAVKQREYQMQIRDFQHAADVKAFNKSNQIADKQIDFNQIAAQQAADSAGIARGDRFTQLGFEGKASAVKMGRQAIGRKIDEAQTKVDLDNASVERSLRDAGLDMGLAKNVAQTLFAGGKLELEHTEQVSQAMSKLTGVDIQHTKTLFDAISSGAKLDAAHLNEVSKAFNERTGLDVNLAKNLADSRVATLKGDVDLANKLTESFQRSVGLDLDLGSKISETDLARRAKTLGIQNLRGDAAVKSQENLIEQLQNAGKVAASGQTGRSAAKTYQTVVSDYNRKAQQISDTVHRADSNFNLELLGLDKGLAYTKAQHGLAKASNIAQLKYEQATHNLSSAQIKQGTEFAKAIHGLDKHEIKIGMDAFKANKSLAQADISAGVSIASANRKLTQAETRAALTFAEASKNLSQKELTQYLAIAESTHQLDKAESQNIYGKETADLKIKDAESKGLHELDKLAFQYDKEARDATATSINKSYSMEIDRINLHRRQANAQANANRMIAPGKPPPLPTVKAPPAVKILDPDPYKGPPSPRRGASYAASAASAGASSGSGGGGAAGTVIGAVGGAMTAAAALPSSLFGVTTKGISTLGAMSGWGFLGPVGIGLGAVAIAGSAFDWW